MITPVPPPALQPTPGVCGCPCCIRYYQFLERPDPIAVVGDAVPGTVVLFFVCLCRSPQHPTFHRCDRAAGLFVG